MEPRQPRLSLDELHLLRWLLGGVLILLSILTVFYLDIGSEWAAALAAASDLIATMPREAATALARSYTLQQFSIPPPWKARALYLLWHARWEDDSAHRWLRDTIRALVDKH